MKQIPESKFKHMVYEKLGRKYPVRSVNPIVAATIDCMEDILRNGDELALKNAFTLKPKLRKERVVGNIGRGNITLPAYYTPYFSPSKRYKEICKGFPVEQEDKSSSVESEKKERNT